MEMGPSLGLICWTLSLLTLASGEGELLKKLQGDNGPPGLLDQSTSKPMLVHLADHPACKKDLAALAPRCQLSTEEMKNDFAALLCVQQRPPGTDQFEAVTETCEQVLWTFKNELTKGGKFIKQVEDACNQDDDKLANCRNSYQDQPGHYLSCVIDLKMEVVLKPACSDFLTQIEMIVFSDYRLIGDFVEKCKSDIDGKACGRVSMKTHSDTQVFYHHSQGTVLECLSDHLETLNETCRHEMLRVAELQSDDYHLDRALYFACKLDRENLCTKVMAGEGRVYECLIQNKRRPEMSNECRKQIRRRQKLMSENYKVSLSLAKACKTEIHENQCRKKTDTLKPVRLAQILLCLEDVVRNEESSVSGRCRSEMNAHRKMLMDDYNMSPEVVSKCAKDIQDPCKPGGKGEEGGMTIHCLMDLASKHILKSGKNCENELRLLLRQSNVADDWTVDPILRKNCQDVVTAVCDLKGSPGDVMSCLMSQVAADSKSMTSDCRKTMMEIQYFLARDFTLDPKLYQKCRKDAHSFCGADEDWHIKSENDDGGDAKFVFPCLVRHLYGLTDEDQNGEGENGPDYNSEQSLSDDCADQVERVLEQRAISVNLHPEIEDSCRDFLVQNCGQATGNKEEMKCLQNNFKVLKGDCLDAVRTYTQLESKNAILNPVIASACHKLIDKHCQQEVSHKDEGDVLQCLIRLKEEGEDGMDDKCSAAVEHWQILSLNDWKFSFKFKQACQADIKELCQHPKTKSDVIGCLSKISRDDILTEKRPPRISKICRTQLKFELLQKHSNIKLNPKLASACGTAIKKFCVGRVDVIECLKQQDIRKLDTDCRKKLFEEEEEEVLQNSIDHALMVGCKHEIKTHCQQHSEPNGILNCLKEVKNDPNFDRGCKIVVNQRVIAHALDYRLRPRLRKACTNDLKKHCARVLLNSESPDLTEDFLEGRVIKCLEAKFAESAELLTSPCRKEIEVLMRDASLDYRANPEIVTKCPKNIEYCKAQTKYDPSISEDGGQIEECLRTLFHDNQLVRAGDGPECKEAVATLIEYTNADIHTDPVLHEACSLDLSKFCREVPQGNSQQLKCLALVLHDPKLKLESKCSDLLQKRMEMFNMALKVVPIQGLQDLILQVSMSPHKNYFLLVVMTLLSFIFIGGLLCGRVTKRVKREMKNR